MEIVLKKNLDCPNQSEKINYDGKNPTLVNHSDQKSPISCLEMPKNGNPDHVLVPKCPNQSGETSFDCKTPILVKESDEKLRNSVLEMPKNGTLDEPNQSRNENFECKTPTSAKKIEQKSQSSTIEFPKNGTPDRLKVPKAFKYPERYNSPTDLMMSPITRGLLARSRKGGMLLPPSKNQLKVHDLRFPEMNLLSQS